MTLRIASALVLASVATAQTTPPQTTPITRGSGWAEPWQARWRLTPMIEVNLATGNLVCAISTGRFLTRGVAPHHDVTIVHNAQRAGVGGDYTGGFDLGSGWSSNLGVRLSFPSSGAARLVLGDGNEVDFELQGSTWACEPGRRLTLESEGTGWVVADRGRWKLHLDSVGRLTSLESSEGNAWQVAWGTQGASGASEPSGRGSTFDYDGAGRLESVSFPSGILWTLAYDANARLGTLTHSQYGTVSVTYDASGRVETWTDYDGFVWEFEYWGSAWPDRLKTITFPDQTTASLAYAGLVHRVITTVTDQRGQTWKSVHDVDDSPVLMARIDPYAKVAHYGYDAENRIVSYEDELGHEWTYTYDALGNVQTVTDPLARTISFGHDSLDRLEEVEAAGETTRAFFADADHERRPSSIVEPRDDDDVAATTTYEYHGPLDGSGKGSGRIEEMADPEGVSTRFELDALGLLDAVHEGPASAAGRVESRFDGVLGPTFVDHGGMQYPSHFPDLPAPPSQVGGRLQWTVASGGSWNWRGQHVARAFDVVAPIDSGTGWETSNVTRTYERDHFGRVTQFTEVSEETIAHASNPPPTPPERTFCVTYGDAASDGAIEIELPGGDTWIWRFDLAGRPTSVSRDDGVSETSIATATYFHDGRVASASYAGGASAHYTYEDNGLVATIEHRLGSTVLLHLDYDYDARNLPVTLTETSGSGTLVKTYGHDQRMRLATESRDDGATVELRTYRYDQVGNRLERQVTTDGVLQQRTLYHYDREDVSTYRSDNNRLTWTETLDGASQIVETSWFFYENPFGNVSRVVTRQAGTTAYGSTVFVYTQYGQPWLTWEEDWTDSGSGPTGVTRGDAIEMRADAPTPRLYRKRSGTTFAPIGTAEWSTHLGPITAAYSASGSDGAHVESFARVPGLGRQSGASFTAELVDRLGSIRRTVRGSNVTAMDYRAFGEPLDATNEPWGFGGGLGARRSFGGIALGGGDVVQMGWRMLAPATGRFAMRDPSGVNDGPNVYAFVSNAPTWVVDPTGQHGDKECFEDMNFFEKVGWALNPWAENPCPGQPVSPPPPPETPPETPRAPEELRPVDDVSDPRVSAGNPQPDQPPEEPWPDEIDDDDCGPPIPLRRPYYPPFWWNPYEYGNPPPQGGGPPGSPPGSG